MRLPRGAGEDWFFAPTVARTEARAVLFAAAELVREQEAGVPSPPRRWAGVCDRERAEEHNPGA